MLIILFYLKKKMVHLNFKNDLGLLEMNKGQ